MSRYLVLLRGINVGGKNLIGMPALRSWFVASVAEAPKVRGGSGNVLVSSGERGAALVPRVEALLSKAFDYSASVVVLSSTQLRRVVEHAPDGFGTRPERFRYDVLFLKAPLTAAQALARVPVNPDVDQVAAGPGVLYYSRLTAKASQSRMGRVVGTPIYEQMTIRNWSTTARLRELMGA
jgi:uncharacterized protein (DUF1697 family)